METQNREGRVKHALYRLDAASKAPRDPKRWPHDMCRAAFNEVKRLRTEVERLDGLLDSQVEAQRREQ